MGDSDDDYSNSNVKRNRDKFHRERDDSSGNTTSTNPPTTSSSSSYNRSEKRDWSNDKKEQWKSKSNYSTNPSNNASGSSAQSYGNPQRNPSSSEYHQRRSNYDSSPPHKKNRWENGDFNRNLPSYGSPYEPYNSSANTYQYNTSNQSMHQHYSQDYDQHGYKSNQQKAEPEYPTQPPCLSFKQFLQQQDDNISDEDAIKKYNEYKIEFKKKQINEFFLAHKEEEWFKARYHPDENYKRYDEQKQSILKRLEVFMELDSKDFLSNVAVEMDKSTELIKFLDAAVIKMEGGDDFDLQSLEPLNETNEKLKNQNENDKNDEQVSLNQNEIKNETHRSENEEIKNNEVNTTSKTNSTDEQHPDTQSKQKKQHKKRQKKGDIESGSESGAYSDSDDDVNDDDDDDDDDDDGDSDDNNKKIKIKDVDNDNDDDDNDDARVSSTADDGKQIKKLKLDEHANEDDTTTTKMKKPRGLHRTTSIFLRNLPPSVTKEELETLFKSHKGYKRVALSDPAPERGFYRRGWVTFDANVNIKDICWSLNNIKIRDCNPGAIVNRDLNRRVRPTTSYICNHKTIIKNDIKLATKIIQNMDKRWKLWCNNDDNDDDDDDHNQNQNEDQKKDEENKKKDDINKQDEDLECVLPPIQKKRSNRPKYTFTHNSNPLLENITEYLVDEMNAEEEELLGMDASSQNNQITTQNQNENQLKEIQIDIDERYKKVLDRLILYLRVVHSFDYYNYIEYQQEDTMPNRCGIIHARASLPIQTEINNSQKIFIKYDDINTYIEQFEIKIKPYLDYRDRLDDESAKKLGLKEKTIEIEKFIQTNAVELAPDRWLCPLSGKKFKGAEFIRKHLFYKHGDKVRDVEKEVEYFNNYLIDPKRPQLPEHPSNKQNLMQSQQQQQQISGQQLQTTTNTTNLTNTQTNTDLNMPMHQQQNYMQTNPTANTLIPPYMMQTMGMNMNRMNNIWSQPPPINQIQIQQQYNRNTTTTPAYNMYSTNAYGSINRNQITPPFMTSRRQPQMGMNRAGSNRELIHYKDLDAPEDS